MSWTDKIEEERAAIARERDAKEAAERNTAQAQKALREARANELDPMIRRVLGETREFMEKHGYYPSVVRRVSECGWTIRARPTPAEVRDYDGPGPVVGVGFDPYGLARPSGLSVTWDLYMSSTENCGDSEADLQQELGKVLLHHNWEQYRASAVRRAGELASAERAKSAASFRSMLGWGSLVVAVIVCGRCIFGG